MNIETNTNTHSGRVTRNGTLLRSTLTHCINAVIIEG